jgi:hypothetical protein
MVCRVASDLMGAACLETDSKNRDAFPRLFTLPIGAGYFIVDLAVPGAGLTWIPNDRRLVPSMNLMGAKSFRDTCVGPPVQSEQYKPRGGGVEAMMKPDISLPGL